MKVCLISENPEHYHSVREILCQQMPYIQFLREQPSLNTGIWQLRMEQPELVFLTADASLSSYRALVSSIRNQSPNSFVIALVVTTVPALAAGVDMALCYPCTAEQLLGAVLRSELHRLGGDTDGASLSSQLEQLPDPKDFLDHLNRELYRSPERLCAEHGALLRRWAEQDSNAVGWHLVGLVTLMREQLEQGDGVSPEMARVLNETLQALCADIGPAICQDIYDKLVHSYIQTRLYRTDPSGTELSNIRQYINEHIEGDVSLKRLAQEFSMSVSSLSRLFKNKTGVNFSDYVSARKVERAKQLLSETDLTIAEISRRLNYPEQNSFSRFFKSRVGMSPQLYRTNSCNSAKEQRPRPMTELEEFESSDFGPCAFTSGDLTYAYSFEQRR